MSPNAELITRIFSETAKGNGRPFVDAMADDMVWRTIGTGAWSGSFRGKETIVNEIFRPLRKRFAANGVTTPTRIIDGGDVVVVQARGRNTTVDGAPYENDYCFVIELRGGKIVSYEEYCDTELVTRVLGPRSA